MRVRLKPKRRPESRKCANPACDTPVWAYNRKFCSTACSREANRAANGVLRPCIECGRPIRCGRYTTPCHAGKCRALMLQKDKAARDGGYWGIRSDQKRFARQKTC